MLQEHLNRWLSRHTPTKATNTTADFSISLGSDIGLTRSENQDRAAAMQFNLIAHSQNNFVAIAVSDGMGGMDNGAQCASLTLSSFLAYMALNPDQSLYKRSNLAAHYANKTVYNYCKGKGGATLSVIIIDAAGKVILLNVGDSRIYSINDKKEVNRLTKDDSLAEIAGYGQKGLLQFIGMEDSLNPHINIAPNNIQQLIITTDGIHSTEPKTFNEILSHSPSTQSTAERLIALAKWRGGHDNATIAICDLTKIKSNIFHNDSDRLLIDDPYSSMHFLSLSKASSETTAPKLSDTSLEAPPNQKNKNPTKDSPQPKKTKKKKPQKNRKDPVQLQIEIEPHNNS